jgi:hypothetical protein
MFGPSHLGAFMKKPNVVKGYYLKNAQQRRASAKRSLSAERAKVKLPYKSEHLSDEELKEGLARLRA